jgi:UDP-N-acetylglucosamine--N-acetylmuramyl-(pentapeptide) pyrophosphoryl-undecaprenol N-acetylglucosamine transferase
MKKILLTGGGSAGHVTPNLAIIDELIKEGWEIHYIGTSDGIEGTIVPRDKVVYHTIKAGKFRRYFDLKNITDPFKVLYGMAQAIAIIRKLKPRAIFSKGGFVSVPVVIGGWVNRIPVIIHESDITPGLANKLAAPFATRICVNFPDAAATLPRNKAVHTGTPIRRSIINGNREKGLKICGFNEGKPVLMIMGGSLGSRNLNKLIRSILQKLLESFQVAHICGKGNIDQSLTDKRGYKQFEYINEEQPHVFKIASMVVSRAGANSIFEFLYLKLPNILIPLSTNASRGDQILNAQSFEKMGFSKVLREENLDGDALYNSIMDVYNNRKNYIENMESKSMPDGTQEIMHLIRKYDK